MSANLRDLEQTLTRQRWSNGLLATVLAVLVIGPPVFGYLVAQAVAATREAVVEESVDRVAKNSGVIMQEGVEVAADISPPLAQAFRAQVKKDMDEYVKVARDQGEKLGESLLADLKQQLKDHYRDFLRKHKNVFEEEFPEHDVDALIAEFEQSFGRLIDRYRLEDFKQEAERTAAIWQEIPPVKEPTSADAPELEEQLADYLSDWLVLRLKDRGVKQLQ